MIISDVHRSRSHACGADRGLKSVHVRYANKLTADIRSDKAGPRNLGYDKRVISK